MVKIAIKSEKLTPFGGIFSIMEQFILRAIKELTQENISYTSDTGKNYDFNTADTLNTLLLNCMFVSIFRKGNFEFYNLRGGRERIFDDMNNSFGWNRLPKSFMAENTVFLLLTALIRNFYKAIIKKLDVKRFGLNATSRIVG